MTRPGTQERTFAEGVISSLVVRGEGWAEVHGSPSPRRMVHRLREAIWQAGLAGKVRVVRQGRFVAVLMLTGDDDA